MKTLFLLLLSFSSLCLAQDPMDLRLQELEARVTALESAVSEKLGECKMVYKSHTIRTNFCDRGTFAFAAQPIGGVIQLECGYYQLQCSR